MDVEDLSFGGAVYNSSEQGLRAIYGYRVMDSTVFSQPHKLWLDRVDGLALSRLCVTPVSMFENSSFCEDRLTTG